MVSQGRGGGKTKDKGRHQSLEAFDVGVMRGCQWIVTRYGNEHEGMIGAGGEDASARGA